MKTKTPLRDTLYLPYKKCLQCEHFGGKLLDEAQSNDCLSESMCPANYIEVKRGLPVDKFSAALAKATTEGDSKRLGKLHSQLASSPVYIQELVNTATSELLKK